MTLKGRLRLKLGDISPIRSWTTTCDLINITSTHAPPIYVTCNIDEFLHCSVSFLQAVSELFTAFKNLFPNIEDRYYRDMPPPGGFEAVKYKRNLPFRGPGGLVILSGVTAICSYGFYLLGRGNNEKRWVTRLGEGFVSAGRGTCSCIARRSRNVPHQPLGACLDPAAAGVISLLTASLLWEGS